jgi:DNA-directed RNA polymerase subunit F
MKLSNEGHYLTLAEVQGLLSEEKELNDVQRLALEHARGFNKLDVKEAETLRKELSKLNLPDKLVCKIVDILPEDTDTVIAILSTDRSRIQENVIKQVLEIALKHVKE